MTTYIALLRAVNVGGTGTLAMADLRRLCGEAGFTQVRTYIQSGNAVFESPLGAAQVRAALEALLRAHMGQPVGVLLRSADQLQAVLAANPFPDAVPSQLAVLFLNEPPAADSVATAKGLADEAIALGARELYVHYPSGMGRSKLKLAAAAQGTARNLNTVRKLVAMAAGEGG